MHGKTFKAWLGEGRDAHRALLLLQQAVADPPEEAFDEASLAKASKTAEKFISYVRDNPLPSPITLTFTDVVARAMPSPVSVFSHVLDLDGEVTNGERVHSLCVGISWGIKKLHVIVDGHISDTFWDPEEAVNFIQRHV